MQENPAKIVSILLVIAFFALGYTSGHRDGIRRSRGSVCDTTWVVKTKWETAPLPEYEKLVSWTPYKFVELQAEPDVRLDTIKVPVVIRDSIYVPITQQYYERLDGRLRLWVSGYQPQLDRWELDERTAVVTKRRRLNFSVGTGVGVIYSPFHSQVDAGLGVFGGLTYSF